MTSEERAALRAALQRALEAQTDAEQANLDKGLAGARACGYAAAYGYLREAVASLLATSERKEPEP